MNCQQKSGVFLNIHCSNTKKNNCSNCNKDVCETHSHTLESKSFCEDCYWERFLYSIEVRENYDRDILIERTTTINTSNRPISSGNSDSSSRDSGFDGGFGGGSFGGGGASGAWTEGDMQSLDDNNTAGGFLSDTDDTFFYS